MKPVRLSNCGGPNVSVFTMFDKVMRFHEAINRFNLQFDVLLDNYGGPFYSYKLVMVLQFHILNHDSNYIKFMFCFSIHVWWNIFWEGSV